MCLTVTLTRKQFLQTHTITIYKVLCCTSANQYGYHNLYTPHVYAPVKPGETIMPKYPAYARIKQDSVIMGEAVHAYLNKEDAMTEASFHKRSLVLQIAVPIGDVIAIGEYNDIALKKLTIPHDIKAHVVR